MHKFRFLLSAALLTLPIATLDSNRGALGESPAVAVETTVADTGWCYVYLQGVWVWVPC